jgi:hypothetical protein
MKGKFFITLVCVLILLIGGVFLIARYGKGSFIAQLRNAEEFTRHDLLKEIVGEVYNNIPLIGKDESAHAFLTVSGVWSFTNVERKQNGDLSLLSLNQKLNQIAELRLKDMFDKQYFEHISPSGVGVSQIAPQVGYEFIAIGENIALGNFRDDAAIVKAWMDSPGHRANILNKYYTEIGIAVGKGTYKGKSTWIGVQVFGRPLSLCKQTDQNLKSQIDQNKHSIDMMESALSEKFAALTNMKNNPQVSAEEYNKKVDEYNAGIRQLNNLIEEVKASVVIYNAQVRAFNTCVGK